MRADRQGLRVPGGDEDSARHRRAPFRIDELDDPERFHINCVNTGAFVELELTTAQEGTFVEGVAGLEAKSPQYKVFDAVAGRRYFTRWLETSLEALRRVATERAGTEVAASGPR
jgi:hypothetical protein